MDQLVIPAAQLGGTVFTVVAFLMYLSKRDNKWTDSLRNNSDSNVQLAKALQQLTDKINENTSKVRLNTDSRGRNVKAVVENTAAVAENTDVIKGNGNGH